MFVNSNRLAGSSLKLLVLFRFLIYFQLLYLSVWGRQIFPVEYLTVEDIRALYNPAGLFRLFSIPFPGPFIYQLLSNTYQLLLLLCMFGIGNRLTSVLALLAGLYVVSFPYQFGFQPHYLSPHLVVLALFCFMKIPSLWAYWRSPQVRNSAAEEFSIYINCFKLVWISIFFMAGIEKLKQSGLEYFFSERHLGSIILSRAYFYDYNTFAPSLQMTRFFVDNLKFHFLFGLGLLLELLTPLSFFKIKKSQWIVIGVFFMQLMIYLLTELKHLWFYLPLYLLFVPDRFLKLPTNPFSKN